MEEPKTTEASTTLEIWVDCPYCDNHQEVAEELKECLGYDLRADNIDEEITCDNSECLKTYIVENITY
jgi:hypothetical protein